MLLLLLANSHKHDYSLLLILPYISLYLYLDPQPILGSVYIIADSVFDRLSPSLSLMPLYCGSAAHGYQALCFARVVAPAGSLA